jgi:hypothetical protein
MFNDQVIFIKYKLEWKGDSILVAQLNLEKFLKNTDISWVWWYISVIPALGRLRQEDHKFKTSLAIATKQTLIYKYSSQRF